MEMTDTKNQQLHSKQKSNDLSLKALQDKKKPYWFIKIQINQANNVWNLQLKMFQAIIQLQTVNLLSKQNE